MPYLYNLNFQTEPCNQYLNDLFNSVVLKDIVKRHNIRDIDLLERIEQELIEQCEDEEIDWDNLSVKE